MNYRERKTIDKLLKAHNFAHIHIFENRRRYKESASKLLEEYFIARGEFEEQLGRLKTE